MAPRSLAVCVLLGLLGALAPGPACGEPVVAGPARGVAEARSLARQHRLVEAVGLLRAEGGLAVDAPERTWLLVHMAPAVSGLESVRREIYALAPGALRRALLAVVSSDAAAAFHELFAWARTRSDPWVELALSYLSSRLGDHAAAERWAGRAHAHGGSFVRVEATLARGRALVEEGRLEEAYDLAGDAARQAPGDSRAHSLRAEILRRSGRIDDALDAALATCERAPHFEPYARRLADLLREQQRGVRARPLRHDVGARLAALAAAPNPESRVLEALLRESEGREREALAAYRLALAAGANPVPVERHVRHLLAHLGDFDGLARALEAALPAEERDSPANVLSERWRTLSATAARAAIRGGPGERLALAEALLGVGALEEGAILLEALVEPAAVALRRRLTGHLALEDVLRTQIEEGYRLAVRKRVVPAIEALLERLREAAARHLVPEEREAFALPARGLRRVPPLGAWLDHRAQTSSPVVAHFRRYGRYLALGQRTGQPCEAIVLALGVLVPSAPVITRGRSFRHDYALGYDRALRSYLDAQGGGLAGACLPDGLWLDADAALDAEADLRSRLRWEPALVRVAQGLAPPPADGPEGPFDLGDPAGVELRILARYAARVGEARWGSLATLRAHENGHVIDIRRHLPLLQGLPATLSLLASVGFAPARMEAVLERRAQLAAVIDAPHPDLAVAEMIALLPAEGRAPEVHAAGYRDALERLVRHIWSRPDLYPEIDRSRRVLAQLDRLSHGQLRHAARAVVDD